MGTGTGDGVMAGVFVAVGVWEESWGWARDCGVWGEDGAVGVVEGDEGSE